jgi:hypothetical protein
MDPKNQEINDAIERAIASMDETQQGRSMLDAKNLM